MTNATQLATVLRRQVHEAEADARLLRERVRDAEARAARAEQAAREAWAFAKTMVQTRPVAPQQARGVG